MNNTMKENRMYTYFIEHIMKPNQPLLSACEWQPMQVKNNPAPHFKYSPVVRAGQFIFVSGMVGLDPETGNLIPGGLATESKRIFDNLQNICFELDISIDQLMLARVYCSDFSLFPAFNDVWNEFFKERVPPARTSVGNVALPLGALIEMEFQLFVG